MTPELLNATVTGAALGYIIPLLAIGFVAYCLMAAYYK